MYLPQNRNVLVRTLQFDDMGSIIQGPDVTYDKGGIQ